MILFFGTRPGKRKTIRLVNATCSYCEQQGTLTAVSQSNYFHLFWIKLFKISSNTITECEHCKRVYYKDEFLGQ
ncbi:MAG: zinc-ribbon domain-containing protein [Maribacter sp.]